MVKTRNQIKSAFLKLREKLMPDKIKVKDICEVAMINKTTFYNHYTDSAELSNEIDDYAVERVVSGFSAKDKIFEDPKAYIAGLLGALDRESSDLKIIFRGKHDVLCAKLEERLHGFYDDMVSSLEDGVKLSFIIGGFVRVVKDYVLTDKKYDADKVSEYTMNMIESIVDRSRPALK